MTLTPVLLLAIPGFVFLTVICLFAWQYRQTRGLAYFGRPQSERFLFKKRVARIGRWLRPLFRLLAFREPGPNQFTVRRDGIHVPANVCNKRSLSDAVNYQPDRADIFVVTQMKCGTTWMQQIVYEILMRGKGDLGDGGDGHLMAISPWLESFVGPEINEAPLLGAAQHRILKTHLPAQLCPASADAKFLCVTRHPASCFASCRDFFRSAAGEFTPPDRALLDWFCSDEMWWGSWPSHVAGWYERSRSSSNVLLIHFEEMKRNLSGVVRSVAAFLGVECSEEAIAVITSKCEFESMKKNEERFEMMPPGFFSTGEAFLKSGAIDRHSSLDPAERKRIEEFCKAAMSRGNFSYDNYLAGAGLKPQSGRKGQ